LYVGTTDHYPLLAGIPVMMLAAIRVLVKGEMREVGIREAEVKEPVAATKRAFG
jgi:hypothetical protein